MKIKTCKGFTLVELLVVVLIIGILASVALPQYTRSIEKARLTEALVTINSLRKAVDVYTSESGYAAADFLGTDATAALDVDLEEGMTCDTGTACIGKYFNYSAGCYSNSFCYVVADRINSGRGTYRLSAYKYKSTRKWGLTCTPNNDGDAGSYICGSVLSKQGWSLGSGTGS